MTGIDELEELAERLPTGPWGWFGGQTSMYLATKHSGRLYLMAFERRGMNGAQPVFRTGHTITPAADLAQFEVGDKSVVGFKAAKKDGSVYRYDIRGFDNDVARWMAACSPDRVLSLIQEVKRLRAIVDKWDDEMNGRSDSPAPPVEGTADKTPAVKLAEWAQEGPRLAKAAGCYVGIRITDDRAALGLGARDE